MPLNRYLIYIYMTATTTSSYAVLDCSLRGSAHRKLGMPWVIVIEHLAPEQYLYHITSCHGHGQSWYDTAYPGRLTCHRTIHPPTHSGHDDTTDANEPSCSLSQVGANSCVVGIPSHTHVTTGPDSRNASWTCVGGHLCICIPIVKPPWYIYFPSKAAKTVVLRQ